RRERPNTETVLEVTNLAKSFVTNGLFSPRRTVVAATDVNLSIRRGEIVGLVGESGSGKSTVARCIVRLTDPSSGHISIKGQHVTEAPQSALRRLRQRFQIVFQDPYRSLNPRRRIEDSVIEGLLNFGIARDKALKRARDLLNLVGIDPRTMRRYPHQFSG